MPKTLFKKISESDFERIAIYFRALSEPNRLKLIAALQSKERSVTELVESTDLSQPNVSRHLNTLLNTGLISRRRLGTKVLYRVTDRTLEDLCELVCNGICRR